MCCPSRVQRVRRSSKPSVLLEFENNPAKWPRVFLFGGPVHRDCPFKDDTWFLLQGKGTAPVVDMDKIL